MKDNLFSAGFNTQASNAYSFIETIAALVMHHLFV
jgi:hypothetical protein